MKSKLIYFFLKFFSVMALCSTEDAGFCTKEGEEDCKDKQWKENTEVLKKIEGWRIDIVVVNIDKSDVLQEFAKIKPPPHKYGYDDGRLTRIPGLPKGLKDIEHLGRVDATSDSIFYTSSRLVTHIDEAAIESLKQFYKDHLKNGWYLVDLCSSWISHLPENTKYKKVYGIGMNEAELSKNRQLTKFRVHDLNKDPKLFMIEDQSVNAVLCTVSVDYLIQPLKVFIEVYRVLKPGGKFIVSFSNRFFPTKVINAWRFTTDPYHIFITAFYFQKSADWKEVKIYDITNSTREEGIDGPRTDPMYVLEGIK